MIAVDNGVEFALKFYTFHNKIMTQGEVNSNDAFKKAVEKLTPAKISPTDGSDIMQYHRHRNDLYHSATFTTISDRYLIDYIKLAKKLLVDLYGYSATEKVWQTQINQTRKALERQESLLDTVIFEPKTIDGSKLIQMKASAVPKNTESILLIIHGYNTIYARPPSNDELAKSLTISGIPMTLDTLQVNLSQQRGLKNIERKSLVLKSSAVEKLKKKFLF
jgi:hypothetical protein